MLNRAFSVAPMLDWTDRHERYFLRLISRHTLLYTEMVTTGAIIYGDHDRYLRFNEQEHPVALQLGGSDPQALAQCAKIGEDYGYDEINLNLGCPSNRVQNGQFGACLMANPVQVAECIVAMRNVVKVPVTAKIRIGIDEQDSFELLCQFVEQLHAAGCNEIIVHARKAILQGLSPKQNREIPPLKYDWVYRLKSLYPRLSIVINGGIKTLADAQQHRQHVDGVMVGREAYHNPYLLAEVDRLFYGDDHPIPSRHEILEQVYPYIEAELQRGERLQSIARHLLGLFQAVRGAKAWRRYISENAHCRTAGLDVIQHAASLVQTS